ncbi:double zinc ribbon domain-containing protein [Anaeroselena agilis]
MGQAGFKFCPSCGSSLEPAACKGCGAKLPPAAAFCPGCGTKV